MADDGAQKDPAPPAEQTSAKPAEKAKGKAKKKRSLGVRIVRGVFFTLLTLVLLLVTLTGAALFYLTTSSGKERVRALVEKRLQEKVNGTVRLGSVDYTLLGPIELKGLVIRDENDVEVISLDRVKVAPDYRVIAGRKAIALDELALDGLSLHILKHADGSSNLKTLFKPQPESKPSDKEIEVRKISISNIDVSMVSDDGTELAIEDLAIEGSAKATPSTKDVSVTLSPISLGFGLKKPQEKGFLVLGLRGVKTGVSLEMKGGKGKAKLEPLTADLSLVVPDSIDTKFPIGWSGIEVDVGDGDLGLNLDKLAVGALSLASVELKSQVVDGKPSGDQKVAVVGLKLDAAQLNEVLGKQILKSNVEVEAHVSGTAKEPKIEVVAKTKGGTVKIGGGLDLADPQSPKHDVRVSLSDVDTTELVSEALAIPPVKVQSLEIHAKGSGKDRESLSTRAEVTAKGVVARGVTIDKVDADVSLAGPKIEITKIGVDVVEQHLDLHGTFDRETKAFDLALGVEGDVGVALAKLKAAGLPITAEIKEGLLKLPKDVLSIHAKGQVGGLIDVHVIAKDLPLLGAKANIDLTAKVEKRPPPVLPDQPAVDVRSFDFNIDIDGVLLSKVLALRNKAIPAALGFDTVLSLHAKGSGTPTTPKVDATITATTLRRDKGPTATAFVAAHVTKENANVSLAVADARQRKDVILTGTASLPLMLDGPKKGIDPVRWLEAHVDLPRRDIQQIVKFVPPLLLAEKPIPQHGDAELSLALTGSLSRPSLKAHVHAGASVLEPEKTAPLTEIALDATLAPGDARAPGYALVVDLTARLAAGAPPVLAGRVTADFPFSPLAGGAEHVRYKGHFDVGPGSLDSLPQTPKLARARELGGDVRGTIDFEGNRRDVTASVRLDATKIGKFVRPFNPEIDTKLPEPSHIDAHVALDLKPNGTTVLVDALYDGSALAKIDGTLGLAGSGLLARAKQGLDPALALDLTIARRPLSSLSNLREKLAKAPGILEGAIAISGTAKAPMASGGLRVTDVAMLDGTNGGAGVELSLDPERLQAEVGIGTTTPKTSPILAVVTVPRAQLFALSKGAEVPIDARITSDHVDLRRVIPKLVVEKNKLEPSGTLDWNMVAKIKIAKSGEKVRVNEASVDGALALKGNVPLPSSKRVYKNVDVSIRAAGSEIAIDRIRAEESDLDVKDRWLQMTGSLVLDKLRPTRADIALKSNKWLLFGTPQIGRVDAPRGILTIDAKAHAELDRPRKLATIDVDHLDVQFPDRFEKAHQPEDLHVGDVVFLDPNDESVAKVGQIPLPESVAKAKKELEERQKLAALGLPPPAPPAPEPGHEDDGVDVDVHVAPGAHLFQSPIDLTTGGSITITTRQGQETKIRGKLVMSKGELSLGGKMHPLREGSLVFDEEHPKGYIDLWFEKKLPNPALRDVSEASAGVALTIHTFGPLSDRKNVLAGAGSPGSLYDLLSMHNVGRELLYSEPDMPGSVAVQFPQRGGLLALSFISVNLPHLLFLDRVGAWADPYDDYRSYGRVEHFEGERYFANGSGRVRAAKQPAGVGRSEAELEVDYLFLNDPRTLFGIGGAVGSRGGGGPTVFFEWSSKD